MLLKTGYYLTFQFVKKAEKLLFCVPFVFENNWFCYFVKPMQIKNMCKFLPIVTFIFTLLKIK